MPAALTSRRTTPARHVCLPGPAAPRRPTPRARFGSCRPSSGASASSTTPSCWRPPSLRTRHLTGLTTRTQPMASGAPPAQSARPIAWATDLGRTESRLPRARATNGVHTSPLRSHLRGQVLARQPSPGPALRQRQKESLGDMEKTVQRYLISIKVSAESQGSTTPVRIAAFQYRKRFLQR